MDRIIQSIVKINVIKLVNLSENEIGNEEHHEFLKSEWQYVNYICNSILPKAKLNIPFIEVNYLSTNEKTSEDEDERLNQLKDLIKKFISDFDDKIKTNKFKNLANTLTNYNNKIEQK